MVTAKSSTRLTFPVDDLRQNAGSPNVSSVELRYFGGEFGDREESLEGEQTPKTSSMHLIGASRNATYVRSHA